MIQTMAVRSRIVAANVRPEAGIGKSTVAAGMSQADQRDSGELRYTVQANQRTIRMSICSYNAGLENVCSDIRRRRHHQTTCNVLRTASAYQ